MRLIREPRTERLSLRLVEAALRLTESARRRTNSTAPTLDMLAGHLSWALLTRLDTQIGTSPTQRGATTDDKDLGQTPPASAHTPMVITVEPESTHVTYYEEPRSR
jgi:hypothetical protein